MASDSSPPRQSSMRRAMARRAKTSLVLALPLALTLVAGALADGRVPHDVKGGGRAAGFLGGAPACALHLGGPAIPQGVRRSPRAVGPNGVGGNGRAGLAMPLAANVGVPLFLRGTNFTELAEKLRELQKSWAGAIVRSRDLLLSDGLATRLRGSLGVLAAVQTAAPAAVATEAGPAAPTAAPTKKRVPGSVAEGANGGSYDTDGLLAYALAILEGGGWKAAVERDGVTTWKKYLPSDVEGSEFPVVKANAMVQAPVSEVVDMIDDSSRIKEYNKYTLGREDIAKVDAKTKVMYNRAKVPMVSRAHDFCSLSHKRQMRDGSVLIVTTAIDHPKRPVSDKYIRSRILLGLTVCKPGKDDPEVTDFTTVTHIMSGGVPVMVADKLSAKNAIDFILNVREAIEAK